MSIQSSNVLASVPPAQLSDLPSSAVRLPGVTEAIPTFTPPPVYRAPFAPAYVYDWMAIHSPSFPAIRQLTYDESSKPYTDLTYHDWAERIRHAGAYALRAVGKTEAEAREYRAPGAEGERMPLVVAICAHVDSLDYLTTVLGIQRAGMVPIDLATNNSADALAHLIRAAGAHHLFVGPQGNKSDLDARIYQACTSLREEGWAIECIPFPSHDTLLHGPDLEPLSPAPYNPDLPVSLLHSSGTTGKWPKLRILRQRLQRQVQLWPLFCPGNARDNVAFVGHLPQFHAMARQISWSAITQGWILAFDAYQPCPRPVDEWSWIQAVVRAATGTALAPPVLYENALQDPQLLQQLRSIPRLRYSGGPMSSHALTTLLKHGLNIQSFFGATEMACVSDFGSPLPPEVREQDPSAITMTRLAQAYLCPLESDHGYQEVEMLWYATSDFAPVLFNGTFDGRQTYSTGDRYRITGLKVPSNQVLNTADLPADKPVYFSVVGRLDDQVPLSNGEKVNPTPILDALSATHQVDHTIVFGKARPRAGLLIQLKSSSSLQPSDGHWNETTVQQGREALWAAVQQANAQSPDHAHISQEMILFSNPERPFLLTGKGSVRSVPTLELYADEVDAAYEAFDRGYSSDLRPPTNWTDDETLDFVDAVIRHALDSSAPTLDADADLFQTLGVDSLSASKIRNVLSAALSSSSSGSASTGSSHSSSPMTSTAASELPSTFVYDHSTPRRLAKALVASAHGTPTGSQTLTPADPITVMQDLIRTYSQPWPASSQQVYRSDKYTFVVTGTTGSMGPNILAQLIARDDVQRVYALNRTSSSSTSLKQRQALALKKQGLDSSILDSPKVSLLSVDLTTEASLRASLGEDILTELEQSVTHIVHAAWRLDFNIPVQSFEAQLSSVRTLASIALRSPARQGGARLVFLSSVTRVLGMEDAPEDKVPLEVAQGGYGRSKAVAEAILASAQEAGCDTVILRAGQLSGNTLNGAWNTSEWLPALFQTSQRLEAMPLLDGQADWIPMDRASGTVIDVAFAEQLDGRILHLANPYHTSFESLLRPASEVLELSLIQPQEWYSKLVQLGDDLKPDETIPSALHLLPFLARITGVETQTENPLPLLSVHKTLSSSETLCATHAVDAADVKRWISWWRAEQWIS